MVENEFFSLDDETHIRDQLSLRASINRAHQLRLSTTIYFLIRLQFIHSGSLARRVCTNGVLLPVHIPFPTTQHFLSHSPHQTVTHDHMLTLVIHVASHHRLLAILVRLCVHPSAALEHDLRLCRAQLMQRPFPSARRLTLTSRPSGVVSLNSTPGVKSYEVVLTELSDRKVHLPAFSLTTSRGLMLLTVMRVITPIPSSFMYASKLSSSTYWHEGGKRVSKKKKGNVVHTKSQVPLSVSTPLLLAICARKRSINVFAVNVATDRLK